MFSGSTSVLPSVRPRGARASRKFANMIQGGPKTGLFESLYPIYMLT